MIDKISNPKLEKEEPHDRNSIIELNKVLDGKNRKLSSLNAELQTFNNIVANHFQETLKKLYTSIEFILTTDARKLSDSGKANLRRSQAAIQKMKLLTDDIIAYANIKSIEELEYVHLEKIIPVLKESLHNAGYAGNIEIKFDCAPPIKAFPSLINLLFYNILENGLKFNDNENSLVTISCKEISGAEILHPYSVKSQLYNVIIIEDNGKGFVMEESENIFNMFYKIAQTGKFKGSGLGLTICKKIMELHQGFIRAESIPGDGSIVYCYFPIV